MILKSKTNFLMSWKKLLNPFFLLLGFMLVVTYAAIGSMDLALALLKQWLKQ